MNMKRSGYWLVGTLLLTVLWGCSDADERSADGGALEKVTFNMSWLF